MITCSDKEASLKLLPLCEEVNNVFMESFGDSSIQDGADDVLKQAMKYVRATSYVAKSRALGALFLSVLQRSNELGMDPIILARRSLEKIEENRAQYLSLGRKPAVGILGGAFDPVTVGHIRNAKHVLDSGLVDFVWLTPCYAHLYGKKMASPEHRLEMCRIAAKADKRILVSDYEIARQFGGETAYMVKKLLQEDFAKDYEFSLIIGQDNANTFDSWSNWKSLEQSIRFIVCPRPGYECDPASTWYMKAPHVLLNKGEDLVQISSTEIRAALADKDVSLPEKTMDPDVLGYIGENLLYERGTE